MSTHVGIQSGYAAGLVDGSMCRAILVGNRSSTPRIPGRRSALGLEGWLLDQSIDDIRDAEISERAIWFGDSLTPSGARLVRAIE